MAWMWHMKGREKLRMASSFLVGETSGWGSHLLKSWRLEEGQLVRRGDKEFTFEYVQFDMFFGYGDIKQLDLHLR